MPFNGTIVGSPTFGAGKFGNGMGFSPGHGCSLPTDGPLYFAAGASFTLEFWFKAASAPGGTRVVIGCEANFWLGTDATGKLVHSGAPTSSGSICDGNWHAIAFSFDGTTYRSYVDGVSVTPGGGAGSGLGQHETIGTGFSGGTAFDMTGQIDELCISSIAQYTGSSYTPATAPFANTRPGVVALYHFESNATDSATPAVPLSAAGNLFVTSVAPGNVQLTANVTGGTAPITYAWYKSTTVNFTPGSGNLLANGGGISGATTATLTDATTLVSGTAYYYICKVTDATPTTVTFPHRPVYLALETINICTIGDSTSMNTAPWTKLFLEASSRGLRRANIVNSAVNGTSSSDWYSGSPQPNLTAALAACGGSFTGFLVLIRLGINDAQGGHSGATFLANLTGIVDYVIAHDGVPFLSYPTWREPGLFGELAPGGPTFDEATTPLLLSYHAAVNGLIDGSTVYPGDRTSYAIFAELPQSYMNFGADPYGNMVAPGAIHPGPLCTSGTFAGSAVFGAAEAAAIMAYLDPSTGGGGTYPTASEIAAAVWRDATAGDFTVTGSIGKYIMTGVTINLAQSGFTPRNLGTVADAAITVGDCLFAAICGTAGKETVVGTTYTIKSPSTGSVIRSFVLDSATAPSSRN